MDYYKKIQNVQKLDLGSPQEAEVLLAFQPAVPGLFADSGKGIYGESNRRSPNFLSLKLGKPTVIGFPSLSITTVRLDLNNQIDMKDVPFSDPVNQLLKVAVSLSTSFLQKYISWLTKAFDVLVH